MRAVQQPLETAVYNDFGLAVLTEAVPRRSNPNTERLHATRPDRSLPFVRETESNYPKSWAKVRPAEAFRDFNPCATPCQLCVTLRIARFSSCNVSSVAFERPSDSFGWFGSNKIYDREAQVGGRIKIEVLFEGGNPCHETVKIARVSKECRSHYSRH